MFAANVFVPGVFRLTNQMLDDLRAAGNYEGQAKRMGRRARPGHDLFAAETERIFWSTYAAWKTWKGSGEVVSPRPSWCVRIFVVGHNHYDPDSFYLLAKPAIDGMVKALGFRDRIAIYDVGGRVAKFGGESYSPAYPKAAGKLNPLGFVDGGQPGFFMEIVEVLP